MSAAPDLGLKENESATDPRCSAWVSANAGSGKTHLLTDRVTRLLLSGADPSRILCLTYTKAAAAEMATRLFNRLGEWALLPDAELRARLSAIGAPLPDAKGLRLARTLFAQALETPGGLKIQTIHAFCQNVIARFPVEAGVPARFGVLDERGAAELLTEARNLVLEQAANGDLRLSSAIDVLSTRGGEGRFGEILDLAIADSGKLKRLLASHGGEAELFAHVRRVLGLSPDEDETQILSEFCAALEHERPLCKRVAEWLLAGSEQEQRLGRSLAAFLAEGVVADRFEHLRSVFFTAENGLRKKLTTKARADSAPRLEAHLNALRERVIAAEQRRRAAVTASLTEALVRVTAAVVAIYDRLKRERAALDYDDLIRATLDLLERHEAALWVLHKLDGGIDHVLVDEAQDTSPEQWRIVEKLSEEFFAGRGAREHGPPRTIFAVGDEKQSIFSFQGADPVQFGRHRLIFRRRVEDAGLPFVDARPAVSRRSARAVLEFVDAVFANAAARDGLTSSEEAIRHDPHRAATGRVEFWPAVKAPAAPPPDPWKRPVDAPSRASAQAILAARIARRIADWIRQGIALPGTSRAIAPGDIMILVRRRNAFAEEMMRQLLERGVPVAGADRMVLMQQIVILDLLALGRFALMPDDDLNLAALLKSPLVGLSEDELYDLAQPRQGRRLWHELRTRAHEREAFASAHGFLSDVLRRADFLPPFEFYARALGKGLRKRLVARLGDEAADAIDEFLSLTLLHESSHPPSLESFLHWFEKGASEIKRDMEQGGGAVRVMTVHGAKGLEANIVILPDTAQAPDHERRGPLLYTDDCVFYAVPKALETAPVTKAKEAARRRELGEYRRLLYVAATRAREFLIVCGYENRNGLHRQSWYPHLLEAARRIGREEQIDGEQVIVHGSPLGGPVSAAARTPPPAELPPFLKRSAEPERVRVLRPSEAGGFEAPALISPLADAGKPGRESRFRRGLLVHALLARLPDVAPEEREHVALTYLRRQGLAPEDAQALAAETLAILTDAQFAPLFGPNSRGEVALSARLPELGDARVSGQIDRLAVTENAVLIADFKTNRPPPRTVAETPSFYRTQMALYRAALAKVYPDRPIDCALIFTDGALLMPLPAMLLDAEIARIASRLNPQNMA